MIREKKHIALVSLNQFDPFLRDGGSHSALARLQFLREQGNQVSIINFLISEPLDRLLFDDALADSNQGVIREDNTCRAVFRGLDYHQEILPYSLEQLPREYTAIIKAIMQRIEQHDLDYVFTLDEGYCPLFAAWFLRIPGAHLFNSLRNVQQFAGNTDYAKCLRNRTVFANSRFLQTQIKKLLGLDSVVWYPFINLGTYLDRYGKARTHCIGFSSTQGKGKGNEIVAQIITRMPERAFIVVGGRYRHRADVSPSNLAYWGHISDMKAFYGQIDLLLVPSLVAEAFARMILEAAVNGVPVIANRRGGIPEALGDSGILIDWDHDKEPNTAEIAEKYVDAIQRVLDDDDLYRHYSKKALARAEAYELEQRRLAHHIYDTYIR